VTLVTRVAPFCAIGTAARFARVRARKKSAEKIKNKSGQPPLASQSLVGLHWKSTVL
jgi:hypothetical protein